MNEREHIDCEVPWPEFESGSALYAENTTGETQESAVSPEAAIPTTPLEVLKKYWGYDSFRGIQSDIIESIMANHDTFGLMPTGGGKSVTFQVPALLKEGLCLVITPLIALMKDQVAHLRKRGIKATAIHSGLTHDQVLREFDNCILGHYKFLYLSPERLQSELFLEKLQRLKVSFITIDEAHCISQWGYDFRPSYLRINDLRRQLPGIPVLALTATATPEVVSDITRQLNFNADGKVFRMSFDRPNLSYSTVLTEDKVGTLIHTLQITEGSTIIYTRSRSGCRDLALTLEKCGITASYYHAGLSNAEKDTRQDMWQKDVVRVMVATNAFGMGIDRPDVRLVMHLDPPDSLEAYFQEAGRAGRDGAPAQAILYYDRGDIMMLNRRVAQMFPPKETVRNIYDDIACFFQLATDDGLGMAFDFNLDEFCRRFHYFPLTVEAALAILQRAGYVEYHADEDHQSRVMFIVRRDDLYDHPLHHPIAERVMYATLRHYSALFSEYVPIDEDLLARDCDCTRDEVYDAMLALTRRRILHYKPRSAMPRIIYQQRRVDHERIVLNEEAYERRMEEYGRRIDSVVNYLTDEVTPCHEQLLAYFGEDVSQLPPRITNEPSSLSTDSVEEAIMGILADGKPHAPAEFRVLSYPLEDINDALLDLMDQGRCKIVHGQFLLTE